MTRLVPLSRGLFAVVDEDDFERVMARKWRATPERATARTVYAASGSHPNTVMLHNFILPPTDGCEVDHRDRDGLNNRRSNLRQATRSQNMWNRAMPVGKCGYRGVGKHRRHSFRAYISAYRKQTFIGCFGTAIEAARAYDREALKLHGEFAILNFPTERDWLIPHEHAGPWPLPAASRMGRPQD